ncbi:MAG: hypothetical protein H6706_27120 [Myxococcales bacterium]|nr:hypothetical protein [Myxococcales bacterium]
MGPIWGLGLSLDRNLTILILGVNLLFSLGFVLTSFRGRPAVDRLLITLGLFLVLTVGSLVGLHLFAATPIRDVQFFLVD